MNTIFHARDIGGGYGEVIDPDGRKVVLCDTGAYPLLLARALAGALTAGLQQEAKDNLYRVKREHFPGMGS